MKVYNIFSSKDQGVFKKDELIGSVNEDIYKTLFGGLPYDTVTNYGSNRVYILPKILSEPHSLNPHPERDDDGW